MVDLVGYTKVIKGKTIQYLTQFTPDQIVYAKSRFKAIKGDLEDVTFKLLKDLMAGGVIEEKKNPKIDKVLKENKEWDRRNKITFGQSMAKIAANKAAGLPPEDLGYLSDEVAAEVGQDLEVELGGKRTQRRVIFVDDVDPERLNLIIGKDPSKPMQSGVKAIPIKVPQPDGSVIVKKGYYQDLNTGDWEGNNGQ